MFPLRDIVHVCLSSYSLGGQRLNKNDPYISDRFCNNTLLMCVCGCVGVGVCVSVCVGVCVCMCGCVCVDVYNYALPGPIRLGVIQQVSAKYSMFGICLLSDTTGSG